MIKPPVLNPGDLVSVIAPASPFSVPHFEIGLQTLRSLGLEIKMTPNLPERRHERFDYLAGSDTDRLEELHAAFSDRDTKAIFCARGGYGSMRLLTEMKPELLTQNPKIFVAYSDMSSILNLLTTHASLVTFHGPVVAKDLDRATRPQTLTWLKRAIMSKEPIGKINPRDITQCEPVTIHPGTARGILAGGNLTLIAALLGTPHEINTDGKILFLEDRGEKLYRVDRLLQQLRLAKKFKKVSGILLGEFRDFDASEEALMDLFRDVFREVEVPVLYGFPAGHCDEKVTLPLGVSAVLNADEGILDIPEAGVV